MLLVLLILSCVVSGILFEGIFFAAFSALLFRNRKQFLKNRSYKWFVLILAGYIAILFITMFCLKTAGGWRPVGITKALCGISLCVLLSDRVCEIETADIYLRYLIVFNFLYVLFGQAGQTGNPLFDMLDYPGQNTLGCLNMITLPHVLSSYKSKFPLSRTVYLLSFVIFFIGNMGFTTIFSTVIVVGWFVFYVIHNHIRIKTGAVLKKFHIIVPVALAVLVLAFFVSGRIQEVYLNILSNTDIDRYNILDQALLSIANSSQEKQMWGRGDNNYYMLSGRYIVAHNFIVEVVTFEGLVGLTVLVLETFVFARFMFVKMEDAQYRGAVMVSIVLGYLFFLLHPVYTTSVLVKIYLVLINLEVCKYKKKLAGQRIKEATGYAL